MGGSERVCQGVERRQLLGVCNGRSQLPPLLIECELKEGAALALDGKRLVERLAIELLVEFHQHCLGLALHASDAESKPGIAGALLAHSFLVERASRDPGEGLIKDVGGSGIG